MVDFRSAIVGEGGESAVEVFFHACYVGNPSVPDGIKQSRFFAALRITDLDRRITTGAES